MEQWTTTCGSESWISKTREIFSRKTTEFFDEGSYRIFPPTGPHITWITAGKKCNSLGPDWKLAQFNSRNDFYSEACFFYLGKVDMIS